MFEIGKWVAPVDACESLEDTIANVIIAAEMQTELLALPRCVFSTHTHLNVPPPEPLADSATTIDVYAF